MHNQLLQHLNIHENSFVFFEKLCNCVYCWDWKDTKKCKKCNKKFCFNHKEDHCCFKFSDRSFSF